MVNLSLFQTLAGKLLPSTNATNATNAAGAPAYAPTPKHQLAQLAHTGTLSQTFYANAEAQLDDVLGLASQVEPKFLAQAAIHARQQGHMKDMPALLLAALSMVDTVMLARAFPRVIDNGRMLRTFVQILRSGAVGRKSLGTRPKRLVAAWLNQATDAQLMRAAVGQSPSLADVIRMVHPKPVSPERQALYAYLIGKPFDVALVPEAVRAFEAFKRDATRPVPDVPFQLLTAQPLTTEHWQAIAKTAGWQMLRMNLNTFARHGVFKDRAYARLIANRLTNEQAIRKARVLPYQLMAAHTAVGADVPDVIREALQDAMEIALHNVPQIAGRVVVCPDVSGSMQSPATGHRRGATSVVRCVDVAALMAAAMLRVNRGARVLPFEQDVVKLRLNPRDSVMSNAAKLAAVGGGGTNCSAPLALLNREQAKADLVIFISDNESWMDRHAGPGTGMMAEWNKLRIRNRDAKLVCIDIQPNRTTQGMERPDILNVGGFSDAVFEVVAKFATDDIGPAHWVGAIKKFDV